MLREKASINIRIYLLCAEIYRKPKDNTILYYDHWEDGFEIDVTRAHQPTTKIWGDGNPANGAPPGVPSDLIKPDTVLVLNNPVDITTLRTVIDFDGGDRISSSNLIAVTRAGWATGSSTLLADAVEVYDTNSWGATFETPVGENLNYNQLFEYIVILNESCKMMSRRR